MQGYQESDHVVSAADKRVPSSLFYGRRTGKARETSAFHLYFDESPSVHLIAA
jgi:hypothetical protein